MLVGMVKDGSVLGDEGWTAMSAEGTKMFVPPHTDMEEFPSSVFADDIGDNASSRRPTPLRMIWTLIGEGEVCADDGVESVPPSPRSVTSIDVAILGRYSLCLSLVWEL